MKTENENTTDRVGPLEKLAYGMGGSFGKDFNIGIMNAFLLVFYTDVFGIGPAVAGTLLLVARFVDAIIDPFMGALADKTRSRWGSYRPYLLYVPVPLAIFTVLTFTVPELPMTGKIVWAFVTYLVYGMFFSAYDVPLWAMVPSVASSTKDRNDLIAMNRVFALIAGVGVMVATEPVTKLLGSGNRADGYRNLAIIIAVVSVISAWFAFSNTRERVVQKKQPPSFWEFVAAVKSKPVVILLVASLLIQCGIIAGLTVGAYYMKYLVQREDLTPWYFLAFMGPLIVGSAIAPSIAKKIGNKGLTTLAFVGSIVLSVVLYFVVHASMYVIFAVIALISVTFGIPLVSMKTMLADTVDYAELKTGTRAQGVIFALDSFIAKTGAALAGGFTGIALQVVKYVPNAPEQNNEVLTGINIIRTILPAVFFVAAVLVIRAFPLDEKMHGEIIEKLKERAKSDAQSDRNPATK